MAKRITTEVDFLRDQVQRLEATLAQYQHRYKPITIKDDCLPNSDAPWTRHEVLSPLLLEYDDSINECMEVNDNLRSEFAVMKKEMDRLVKDNDRLREGMKGVMEKAFNEAELLDGEKEDVNYLKQQLEMALQEKEHLSEMCQAALSDVDRLELEVDKLRTNPQWRQTAEVKVQYNQAVGEMSKEVSELQDQLRRSKAEQRTADVQVSDLRRTLDELREQLLIQKKAHHEAVGDGVLFQEENALARRKVDDQDTKIYSLETEFETLATENKTLNETCRELQTKCVELEQKEYEASLQVRDSVQLVENAVLERDQVRIHEQQLLDENRKLQDAINKLLDEAGFRTREEVENVKELCNANLERLTEELYQIEMENVEKTSQMERLVRDKKHLETELETCYKDGLMRGTNDQNNLAELTRRACSAEAERDEALIKYENLHNHTKRYEISHAQEKQQLMTECKQLKERMDKMNVELDRISQERLQTQDQLDSLKRQLFNVHKEKDATERKFARDLAALEQEHSLKERSHDVRLQTLEDSHRQSLSEARRHVNTQQKAAAKWKVECESITQQFDRKVAELRAESARMKQKNIELIHLLAESQKKTADARNMVVEYTKNVKKMEERIREAEQSAKLEQARINRTLYRDRRRPYSPADSDSQGHTSPVLIYGTDDFISGGSR